MKALLRDLFRGNTPFCCIQKQDSDELLFLKGSVSTFRNIQDIPRTSGGKGKRVYDTISMVPFCQIRERGYSVIDEGEPIRTIEVESSRELEVERFLQDIPGVKLALEEELEYDTSEEEYERIIHDVVEKEIGNGEGANFVVARNGTGKLKDFSVSHALSLFTYLLKNDYGTYWKFIFYDTDTFFIGSTPERHLLVEGGQVKMNPISGTFKKSKEKLKRRVMKSDLLNFLNDKKEINELFMVVDEELKMMAKMCEQGGAVYGPSLKEMSKLIHTEYLLSGKSNKDIFELFTDSMFAATVVGSPVESACRVITRYSQASRRYYGSGMMLVGRDEEGRDFLDSPITIRTIEVDRGGTFHFSVGATLVKDSVPKNELRETKVKSDSILGGLTDGRNDSPVPRYMSTLASDDDIIECLASRNEYLSNFWFFRQKVEEKNSSGLGITLIHNEDDFVYMLRHMLDHLGYTVTVVRYSDYDVSRDYSKITVMGQVP